MDDGDARRLRFRRRVEIDQTVIEGHSTFVAFDGACENIDDRALAGAVFADERMNLAGRNVEVDVTQCVHAAIPLVHVLHEEQWRLGARRDHHCRGVRNRAAFSFVMSSAFVYSLPYGGSWPATR